MNGMGTVVGESDDGLRRPGTAVDNIAATEKLRAHWVSHIGAESLGDEFAAGSAGTQMDMCSSAASRLVAPLEYSMVRQQLTVHFAQVAA